MRLNKGSSHTPPKYIYPIIILNASNHVTWIQVTSAGKWIISYPQLIMITTLIITAFLTDMLSYECV